MSEVLFFFYIILEKDNARVLNYFITFSCFLETIILVVLLVNQWHDIIWIYYKRNVKIKVTLCSRVFLRSIEDLDLYKTTSSSLFAHFNLHKTIILQKYYFKTGKINKFTHTTHMSICIFNEFDLKL